MTRGEELAAIDKHISTIGAVPCPPAFAGRTIQAAPIGAELEAKIRAIPPLPADRGRHLGETRAAWLKRIERAR